MPRLRRLTAREVLKILADFGFFVGTTRGSDAKVVRVLHSGGRQALTVALDGELAVGTLQAIYRQESRFIAEADLRERFYSD